MIPIGKIKEKFQAIFFKVKSLRNMLDVFIRKGECVLQILENHSKSGEAIDIQDLFSRFTTDSICEIAFGKDVDTLHKANPFAQSFNKIVDACNKRFFLPIWPFFGKLVPFEAELHQNLPVINELAATVILEKKEKMNNEDTDVLSSFINTTDENGKPFTNKVLRDIIMNFLIAGKDTITQTLTWTTYLLTLNPKKEKKLLEELNEYFPNGKIVDYDTIKQMEYIKCVINEDLRLYPPVPLDPKCALQEDILPNGLIVQKGWNVAWSAHIMGRLEEYWDNPEEFRPERFLNDNNKNMHPYLFIPFQAGLRTCLGKDMAYLEVSALLSMILPKFRFELVEGHPIKITPSATISATYGIKMIVKKKEINKNIRTIEQAY